MRLRRAPAVRTLMVVTVAAASVVFFVSGPRLRAQNPAPVDAPAIKVSKAGPIPTQPLDLPSPSLPPVEPPPTPSPLPMPTESPTAPTRVLPSSSAAPGPMLDPEAAAFGFVERTTKEADEAIKALAKEAETLRTRLQKVEAGLTRWQAVKTSLESNGPHASWKSRSSTGRSPVEAELIVGEVLRGPFVPAPNDDSVPSAKDSRKLSPQPDQARSPIEVDRSGHSGPLEPFKDSNRLEPAKPNSAKPDAVEPPPTILEPASPPPSKPSETIQKK